MRPNWPQAAPRSSQPAISTVTMKPEYGAGTAEKRLSPAQIVATSGPIASIGENGSVAQKIQGPIANAKTMNSAKPAAFTCSRRTEDAYNPAARAKKSVFNKANAV